MAVRVESTPFPRSVRTYVGRVDELARVRDWLDRETLFVIYGVGGIGKSEFVYRVIEEVRGDERWRDSRPMLLRIRPGMTAEHALARLQVALGVERGLPEYQQSTNASSGFEEDLTEAARMLEARPTLLFVDDVHHLDPVQAGQMLSYLSRHVRRSRLFVASRVEVPLPPGTPLPVLIRLSPLDSTATAALVAELTHQLGIESLDPEDVYHRSGGSPFFVQRLLVGDRLQAPDDDSTLHDTLRELTTESRRLLLLFAILRDRFATGDLLATASIHPNLGDVETIVRDLSRRLLVDVSRDEVMIHDLICDALLGQADEAELAEVHKDAARLYEYLFLNDPVHRGLDAVEAVYHSIDADDVEYAWLFAESSYSKVAAAGLDHLLPDALLRLRERVEEYATAIDLMRARIATRQSLIDEAAEILDGIANAPDLDVIRYSHLAGEVSRRRGQLARAEEHFLRARERAKSATERFHNTVLLADVRSMRGLNEQARTVLDAAISQFDPENSREYGRWGLSMTISYLFEERFVEAVETARDVVDRLREAGTGGEDIVMIVATQEVLARAESNDVAGARRLIEEIVAVRGRRSARASALREQLVALYTGVTCYAEGRLHEARSTIEETYRYMRAHADHFLSRVAAFYLVLIMLAQGDLAPAMELTDDFLRDARDSEMRSFLPGAISLRAVALLAAGHLDEARILAQEVLNTEPVRYKARWNAYIVLMRSHALAGEYAEARRYHAAGREFLSSFRGEHWDLAALLEEAGIELMAGNANRAVEAATVAWRGYAECGRRWLEARAAVALAAALVARGRATDVVAAEKPLARAEYLSVWEGYQRVVARAALVRAALLARDGRQDWAQEHLISAVRTLDAHIDRPEIAALRVALQGTDDDAAWPGERAVVAALGLIGSPRYRVIDRNGERRAAEHDVVGERSRRDLVAEPDRATITAGGGERSDAGRPMVCELLARLIEARGAVVTAEELFRDVWGGREYHPLRHRNTVYVAVKRLRQTLRKLLGDREVIETASGGWRVADGIDAASIRSLGK